MTDENINEMPRTLKPERKLSRSGSMEKSKAILDTLSERVMVETMLIRLEQHREFQLKAKEYLPDDFVSSNGDGNHNFISGPDIFPHRGVHYWEGQYNDVVIIPSLTLDTTELAKVKGVMHYEERQLFNLILLRKPSVRLIYVTSMPLDPAIIEYYWKLLPERIPFSEICSRLIFFSVHDDTPKSLTEKILERPRLVRRIKKCIRNPESACITCFNSTIYEKELADKLGVPLLGTSPDTSYWGTKIGSHEIFDEAGIPHPKHTKLMYSSEELASEIVKLLKDEPNTATLVVKLNESFTGEGNANLYLSTFLSQSDRDHLRNGSDSNELERIASKIHDSFDTMEFSSVIEKWPSFKRKITFMGALAEIFIDGENKTSPSGQACVDDNGTVGILSTHEQLLGGLSHQIYQGCKFPAHHDYKLIVQDFTHKVGIILAKKGVTDHFGVDFIATKNGEKWELSALEINLRQGGTTHPMMTLKLLTNGQYSMNEASFVNLFGKPKFYVASDNICDDGLKTLLPIDIVESFTTSNLHFNQETEKGVVFHLLGSLSKYGKLGATCIADSPEEAEDLYQKTIKKLKEIANEDINI